MKAVLPVRLGSVGFVCLTAYILVRMWFGAVTAADLHHEPSQTQNRYVSADLGSDSDNDCTDSNTTCATIQHAVDQAVDNDIIYIGVGLYQGVQSHEAVTQVVYIDKALTLQGGCDPADWAMCETIPQSTIIDAQQQGRGLFISHTEASLIGLTVINGDAAGLGGAAGSVDNIHDAGGGLYTTNATVTVQNSFFFENTALLGGGAYFYQSSESQVVNGRFEENTIAGGGASGAAIAIRESDDFVLSGTVIQQNRTLSGGGMQHRGGFYALLSQNLLVKQNLFDGNHANNTCGGLCLNTVSNFIIEDNLIINNTAGTSGFIGASGGGFQLISSSGVMNNNIIQGNQSLTYGGGGALQRSDVTFHNNVFMGNEIGANPAFEGDGSALLIAGSSPQLVHTTFTSNTGGLGSALQITDAFGTASMVTLTNTIMDHQQIGVRVASTSTAVIEAILWSNLVTQTEGPATVTLPYLGDPAFVADGYHLTADSAALNRGIPTSVTTDIDGQAHLDAPDLGADEFYPAELELVSFQTLVDDPAAYDNQFIGRLASLQPHTTYVVSSYHDTDIAYEQEVVTVTTDAAGLASLKIKSRCLDPTDQVTGTVFIRLAQNGVPLGDSNHISCETIASLSDFGSYLVDEPENDDGIYRPSPPGPDMVRLWVRDADGRTGLTGTVRIQSTSASYWLPEQTLIDAGNGLYYYDWSIADKMAMPDYRVQMTLSDAAGNLSGVDQFTQLSGRAAWLWLNVQDILTNSHHPYELKVNVQGIYTNTDNDKNSWGDQDKVFAFADEPYQTADPSLKTIYFNVYPSISFIGTTMTETWHTFLHTAHFTQGLRIEALAGTHEWVNTDAGMADAKQLCDVILAVNTAADKVTERFAGIHYDIEHDEWDEERWARYIEIITYCQQQIDAFNETHNDQMVFGVDIPPRFLTESTSTGKIESAWDVLTIVDMITLMDYRDFAVGPNGIIEHAEPFITAGNALGKPIVIGVELTSNQHEHVTFYEESIAEMEAELELVSQHFVTDWSYHGLALHDYDAWNNKVWPCESPYCLYLPIVIQT